MQSKLQYNPYIELTLYIHFSLKLTFPLKYDLLDWFLHLDVLVQSSQSRLIAIFILAHHIAQERYIADGQLQGVHFAQLLLVRQRWNVRSQPFEGFVDALHASAFTHVGCLSLLHQLMVALKATWFNNTNNIQFF